MAALVHFDRDGQWGETLVCAEAIQRALSRHGIRMGEGPPTEGAMRVVAAQRESPLLLYVDLDEGWLGLLLEDSESAVFPPPLSPIKARSAFVHDSLPLHDAFIETLLSMLGHGLDED